MGSKGRGSWVWAFAVTVLLAGALSWHACLGPQHASERATPFTHDGPGGPWPDRGIESAADRGERAAPRRSEVGAKAHGSTESGLAPTVGQEGGGQEEATDEPGEHRFLVLSADGYPVEGARVLLTRRSLDASSAEAVSSARGEVQLAGLPGDDLVVEAASHVARRLTLPAWPWTDPYPLTLDPGVVALEGVTVDDQGTPIAGAQLTFLVDDRPLGARSDEDGRFALRVPSSTPFPLRLPAPRVRHPDYFDPSSFEGEDEDTRVVRAPGAGRPMRVVLLRWVRLELALTDGEGAEVCGARLQLLGPPEEESRTGWSFGLPVLRLSCDEGWPILHIPPLLPLWLGVEHPDWVPTEVPLPQLYPGQAGRLSVVLERLPSDPTVRFRIEDPGGSLMASAEVGLYRHETPGPSRASFSRLTPTHEGHYAFRPHDGSWWIEISAPGYAPARLDGAWVAATRGQVLAQEVRRVVLEPGGVELRVRAVGLDGAPYAGLTLNARSVGGDGAGGSAARTDGRGEASFAGLDPDQPLRIDVGVGTATPGSYGTAPWVPDPPAYREVLPGGDPVLFRLVEPGAIEGLIRIRSPEGKFAVLSCMGPITQPWSTPVFNISSALDADGNFYFAGLPPGRYHLWMEGSRRGANFDRPLAVLDLAPGQRLRPGPIAGD